MGISTLALAVAGYALYVPAATRARVSTLVEAGVKVIDPTKFVSLQKEPPWLRALSHSRVALTSGIRKTITGEMIVEATNRIRLEYGLSPLGAKTSLNDSAKKKVEDMLSQQYFDHVSPDGKAVSDFGEEAGYRYIIMGENLALGSFRDTDDLLEAWMESEGHRANILNTSYKEMGAYAIRGIFEGKEVWVAVQHFGVSRAACPAIDNSLKEGIDAMNEQLARQEITIESLSAKINVQNSNQKGYEETVNEFNRLITAYNQMRDISKGMVSTYNQQVAQFNDCLSKYQ